MKKFSKTACVTLASFICNYIIFAIVLWNLTWILSDYDGINSTRMMYVIFSLFQLFCFAIYNYFNKII